MTKLSLKVTSFSKSAVSNTSANLVPYKTSCSSELRDTRLKEKMATRRFGTGVKGKRKNFGSSQNNPEFRRPKAAFRGAEAASQNFEKAFLVCHYSGRALLLPFVLLHFISNGKKMAENDGFSDFILNFVTIFQNDP